MTGDHLKKPGRIAHAAREGSDVIERTRERGETVAGNAAISGRNARDAAERGGLANGAAGVRAER